MPVSVLLQQILIIFLEIGIGAVAAKCKVIRGEGSKVLSDLVMYITLPCTLLASTNITGGGETVLLGIRLPAAVQSFVSAVGNCTTPLALMIVGVMLAGSRPADLLKKPFLYLTTGLRCILFPLLFILVLWLLPLDRTLCMGITILASCPAGSMAAVAARQNDVESELASQAVAQSTLFIVVSIPVLLTLAGALFQ